MKILYINACVRKDSRTNELAQYLIKKYNQEIEEVNLEKEDIQPLNEKTLNERTKLIWQKDYTNPLFNYAKQFAMADKIIVGAPYWDLSFPAKLKAYFEAINVSGLTFYYSEKGSPESLCKAKELIYITTAGGRAESEEFGFGYVKALCNAFYGINDVKCIKAEGLDIFGADIESILNNAKKQIDGLF